MWRYRRCRYGNVISVVVVVLSLATLAVSSQHDTRGDLKVNGQGQYDNGAADWADNSLVDVDGSRTFYSPLSDARSRGKCVRISYKIKSFGFGEKN